jgi:hypothetical protein
VKRTHRRHNSIRWMENRVRRLRFKVKSEQGFTLKRWIRRIVNLEKRISKLSRGVQS